MEKQAKCPWCGHERCSDCQKDKWPELHDGCCQCRRRFVSTLKTRIGNLPRSVKDRLKGTLPLQSSKWLIPQFRHNLDGEEGHVYATREGQQQVFRVTFLGIRNSVRALLARRMDALARKFYDTHDVAVSDEIYRLSRELIKLKEPCVFAAR